LDYKEKDINEQNSEELSDKARQEPRAKEIKDMVPEELAVELIKRLHLAIQKMEMYGSSHPIADEALHQAHNIFREALKRRPTVTLSASGDGSILVDDIVMPNTYFTERFAHDFEHHRVHSLSFYRNMSFDDLMVLLKFLERQIGHRDEKSNIEEHLKQHKINTIEVNRVHYKMVVGDEQEGGEEGGLHFFRKDKVEQLFGDHPEIIAKLIGAESLDTTLLAEELTDEIPAAYNQLNKDEIIDKVIRRIQKETLVGDEREIDRKIETIIDDLKRSLSDDEKEELRERLERFHEDAILDKKDRTAEYMEDVRIMQRVGLTEELGEYISSVQKAPIQEDSAIRELQERLRSFLNAAAFEAESEDAENMYSLLMKNYEKTPLTPYLGATKELVDALFEKAADKVVRNFVTTRVKEKQNEKSYSRKTEILTTALVWTTSHLLERGMLLSALHIARSYDNKRQLDAEDSKLVEDAETFFDSLSVGDPLNSLVTTLEGHTFQIPSEVLELFRLVNSRRIPERVLEIMEYRDRDYAILAAEALWVMRKNAAWVFANEVRGIKQLKRDVAGYLPSDTQRRRATGAIIALAILADELALPILAECVGDSDPAVRFAALEAISRIDSPKATKLLVRYLSAHRGEWQGDLLRLIPRMDPETAVPLLVQYFHTRRDKWLDIIHVVGQLGGPEARNFLMDTLDTWSFYTGGMNNHDAEEFMLTLLDAINHCIPDPELKRALKMFISEWKGRDVIGGIAGVLKLKTDRVIDRAKKILAEWKNSDAEKTEIGELVGVGE